MIEGSKGNYNSPSQIIRSSLTQQVYYNSRLLKGLKLTGPIVLVYKTQYVLQESEMNQGVDKYEQFSICVALIQLQLTQLEN